MQRLLRLPKLESKIAPAGHSASAGLEGADSLIISKWFEGNPDFDRADGCAGFRDTGESFKLRRVLLSTSGVGQPWV
jgi:hypothetical protein